MGKNRYWLPHWAREAALAYVRGYEDMSASLAAEEAEIIYGSPARGERYTVRIGPDKQEERLAFVPSARGYISDSTGDKGARLAALYDSPRGRIVRIVDQALFAATANMDECLQYRLMEALRLNCTSGRQWRYEYFALHGVSRSGFYRRRDKVLYIIATATGIYHVPGR